MGRTHLDEMVSRAERVLAEYRAHAEPLKSALLRKQIARRLAKELKTYLEEAWGNKRQS